MTNFRKKISRAPIECRQRNIIDREKTHNLIRSAPARQEKPIYVKRKILTKERAGINDPERDRVRENKRGKAGHYIYIKDARLYKALSL